MSIYKESDIILRQAVLSILKQSYKNIELIVVIDNPENVNAYAFMKSVAKTDRRVKIVVNESNRGLPYSLNEGIKYVTGEYIARMDADDISFSNRLVEELDFLKKGGYDLVASKTCLINENGKILSGAPQPDISGKALNRIIRYTDCMPHPTWLARRELYKKIGGYREIRACEDYDFLIRAIKSGAKIGFLNQTLLYYRCNPIGISCSNSLRQSITSYYLSKYMRMNKELTEEQIERYVKKASSEKEQMRYSRATKLLLNAKTTQNKIKKIRLLFKSIFISKYILINYLQLIHRYFYVFVFRA